MAEFDFTTAWNEALVKEEALLEAITTPLTAGGAGLAQGSQSLLSTCGRVRSAKRWSGPIR
jgi:hypothetical protein